MIKGICIGIVLGVAITLSIGAASLQKSPNRYTVTPMIGGSIVGVTDNEKNKLYIYSVVGKDEDENDADLTAIYDLSKIGEPTLQVEYPSDP